MVPVPPVPEAGRRLGDYVLEEHIGAGGIGQVFVARRPSDGERVALKVINPVSVADAEAVAQFRRETKFMLGLDHPHIVKVFDVGTVEGQHYLSMEYVPGENLKQLILREGRLEPGGALRTMRQIADALDYGARREVMHRNLKPENILIRADGVAKVADMGLAILANRENLNITAAGFTLGTPEYMSPEQARAQRDTDTRSDVYSLGCTFYHAICARPPFEGANPILVVAQHLKNPPAPPSELVPGLAEGVEAILLRCMEKDRESRFQTCAELVQAIDDALGSAPGPRSRAGPARRRSAKSARRHLIARRFEEASPPANGLHHGDAESTENGGTC
ncbi:MAG: serine/threonine-protein kinase [Planctomycetota bacterium]|jgi:serine/threonine protein kinase